MERVAKYSGSPASGALRQGEVVSTLYQATLDTRQLAGDTLTVSLKLHAYAVILTQDCDLDSDYAARFGGGTGQQISDVLFGVVEPAESVRRKKDMNSSLWAEAKKNKSARYQFLEAVPTDSDSLGLGVPELVVDFKLYFTMPTDELYVRLGLDTRRRCYLVSPYREHLSSRFAHYLSRVGLPEDHTST